MLKKEFMDPSPHPPFLYIYLWIWCHTSYFTTSTSVWEDPSVSFSVGWVVPLKVFQRSLSLLPIRYCDRSLLFIHVPVIGPSSFNIYFHTSVLSCTIYRPLCTSNYNDLDFRFDVTPLYFLFSLGLSNNLVRCNKTSLPPVNLLKFFPLMYQFKPIFFTLKLFLFWSLSS